MEKVTEKQTKQKMFSSQQSITTNSEKREESDFQSYHFITEHPVFKQQKMTRKAKGWGSMSHSHTHTKQWREIAPDKAQRVNLLDKYLKAVVFNMLKKLKKPTRLM